MRRRDIIVWMGGAAASPFMASVARGAGPAKIGWLKIQGPRHSPDQLKSFREGMVALGQIEGRDYVLVERFGDDQEERLMPLASELVGLDVRLIVATSQPSIAAAARVTRTVPIIGRFNDDPVVGGMARSLARPGDNISGVYSLAEQLTSKRLSLLKELVPSARRVGVLLRDDSPDVKRTWQAAEAAAKQLGIELVALNARSAGELSARLEEARAEHLDGIITFRNSVVVTNLALIAELCLKDRLPACSMPANTWMPAASCPTGRTSTPSIVSSRDLRSRSSAAHRSATCRSSNRPNSSWSSTAAPPMQSDCGCRRTFRRAPMT